MKPTRDTMGPSYDERRGMSRREFLQSTGLTTMALGTGALGWKSTMATAAQSPAKAGVSGGDGPYNILFILTDQERYFHPTEYPSGYALPGRERLQRQGVTFTNHYINSAVCTSSRSVIYIGQHIQHTKLFDNMNVPWVKDLSHDIPTVGDMLGEAGYYAAYKRRSIHEHEDKGHADKTRLGGWCGLCDFGACPPR